MRKTTLILCIFCCATALFAQKIFNPGYVVKLNGDTLRGFVLESSYEILSREVAFKTTENAVPATYKPADLRGFGINNGQYYLKHHALYYRDATRGGTERVVEDRFLRLIEDGAVQLYILERSDVNYALFVRKGLGALEPLYMAVNLKDDLPRQRGGKSKVLSSDTVSFYPKLPSGEYNFRRFYYGVLQNMFLDCPNAALKSVPELEVDRISTEVRRYNNGCGKKNRPLGDGRSAQNRFKIAATAGGYFAPGTGIGSIAGSFPALNVVGNVYGASVGFHIGGGLRSKRVLQEFLLTVGVREKSGNLIVYQGEQYNTRFYQVQWRANFLFMPERRLTPHFSAGIAFAQVRVPYYPDELKEWVSRFNLSAGAYYFFKNRNFIRLETSFPDRFSIGLTAGYVIR